MFLGGYSAVDAAVAAGLATQVFSRLLTPDRHSGHWRAIWFAAVAIIRDRVSLEADGLEIEGRVANHRLRLSGASSLAEAV